ncbi:MAG: hypothetical protein KH359_06205 [Clostridiales bacterium]|nr:hypothetical protein [Clostridiales bacterium]
MKRYKIAGCVVDYEPMYSLLQDKMERYCWEEETEQPADISLKLTEEFLREKQKLNPHLTVSECEYVWAGLQFYTKLLKYHGFMLHASAIEVDGKAYLFSADSGVGKSTHAKLWKKFLGDENAQILNDDKPAVVIEDDSCLAYGTPFSGKSPEHLNRKAKIQGICMLERGAENRIWRISGREALLLLMRQVIWPRNKEEADKLLGYLGVVLKQVPLYRMKCNLSVEAAQKAYEMMKEEIV